MRLTQLNTIIIIDPNLDTVMNSYGLYAVVEEPTRI